LGCLFVFIFYKLALLLGRKDFLSKTEEWRSREDTPGVYRDYYDAKMWSENSEFLATKGNLGKHSPLPILS
jgi:hypothetical protein